MLTHINDAIFLPRKDKFEKTYFEDMLFIKADNNCIDIQTRQAKKYTVSVNLKSFLEQCTHPTLLRVHRSYVVNIQQVEAVFGRQLEIAGTLIPVSDTYLPTIKAYFPMLRTGK